MKEEGQNYRAGVKAAVDMDKTGGSSQEAAATGEQVAAEAPAEAAPAPQQ